MSPLEARIIVIMHKALLADPLGFDDRHLRTSLRPTFTLPRGCLDKPLGGMTDTW